MRELTVWLCWDTEDPATVVSPPAGDRYQAAQWAAEMLDKKAEGKKPPRKRVIVTQIKGDPKTYRLVVIAKPVIEYWAEFEDEYDGRYDEI